MTKNEWSEELTEQRVTYTLLMDDKFYVVENVPARVNLDTGEQFFSPQTVESLHKLILGTHKPKRMIQTPVFEFA